MSHEDQNQGSTTNQTTEQVEKEEVHLSPATRKQAQDAINAGHQDRVDPAIKEKLLAEQAQRNHDPVPEQPAPVEAQTAEAEDAELEVIEEAIQEVEPALHEAIFSDAFVISEPRVKVQLIIPLISGSEEVDEDEWTEELEDGTPLSFKHTLANGSGKKGTLGVMYNTVLSAVEAAAELNGSNIKVANTEMTRQAMAEIMAQHLTERCQIVVPEEMSETIVERFDQTASFYPGVLATPLVEEDSVAIQVFTPVPLIATSDDKLGRYIELIEKYFGEYDADIEIILLADPIETVFDDVQRTNVRVAVEELGFAINTMDNLITAVESDVTFDIDDEDDEEGWDDSDDDFDSDDEDDSEKEDTDEDSDDDEVVEDDADESDDESESDDEFGFTLPQSMDRMSHLIRDENNLSGLGLIVLGKKL